MSRACLFLMPLTLFAAPVRGADVPRYDTVPQAAPEQIAKLRAEHAAYLRRTVRDRYEAVGEKDSRWNEDARKALDAVCRYWMHVENPWDSEVAWQHAAKAVKAGCTDPLIQYLFIRMAPAGLPADPTNPMTNPQILEFSNRLAERMKQSKYPAFRIAMAILNSGRLEARFTPKILEAKEKLSRSIESAFNYLPEALKDPSPYARVNAYDLCRELLTVAAYTAGDRKPLYERVMKVLESDPDAKKLALLVKGDFYVDYAWDARGNGPASAVTEQGWKDMAERLKMAETALEEAWKAGPNGVDPLNARIAVRMIGVELGQRTGRERMELWFQRAMTADPDNVDACLAKMNYLEPKWHGSPGAMREFGQACFKTDNWEGPLPLMLLNVHLRLSANLQGEAKRNYFQTPEVQKDVRSVLETVIQKYPENNYWRTLYVDMAVRMGDKAEARKQMKALGDNFSRKVFSPPQYRNLRRELEAGAEK